MTNKYLYKLIVGIKDRLDLVSSNQTPFLPLNLLETKGEIKREFFFRLQRVSLFPIPYPFLHKRSIYIFMGFCVGGGVNCYYYSGNI